MSERHAVYATCDTPEGPITFRVGQPVYGWSRALARFHRLWTDGAIWRPSSATAPRVRVRHDRKIYRVKFMEVRAVDRHGRALGSERHERAIPVPCVKVRKVAA